VYDQRLRTALEDLGRAGVLVVAAAGNNATSRPMLPAWLTPYRGGALLSNALAAPVVSVGALNPDGTVALFSNSGDWVSCFCPGAALVSTLPIVDAGAEPGISVGEFGKKESAPAVRRTTIDPDNFTGFGTWSGTSFAAPVMAGAAAQKLWLAGGLDQLDAAAAVGRAQQALLALGFPPASP
jgi:subtilisin family serine protease